MKNKLINIENNSFLNNYDDQKIFSINSNITGLSLKMAFPKKEKENRKLFKLKKSNSLFHKIKNNNNNNESALYQSLPKKGKIKYIQKLIKNSILNEPFDCLAVKRKKYSLSYLIRQFNNTEKSKSYEKNIFKSPYPLLYCISNRKVGNDSSNLLNKILTSENKHLSKKQEKEIKTSVYSKIFNKDISDIIKNKIRSKTTLKNIVNKKNNHNTSKLSIFKDKHFPFLNKYIKNKVNNYKCGLWKRNNIFKYLTSSGFFSGRAKNMKRWNSSFFKNNDSIENFKNKTVCLENHNNNFFNNLVKEIIKL